MPNGGFMSDQLAYQGTRGGSGGSMTGTGAPSNPRWALGGSPPAPGGTDMTNAGPRYNGPTAGGSGYTTQTGGAFDRVAIGGVPTGMETGLYGLPGQNPATEPSPANNLSSITSMVNTMYGPQQQILADQLARQQDQIGLIGLDVDYKTDALHRDTALQRQLLGIDREALGLETGLVKGQLGNVGRLRDILGKRRGIAGEVKGNTLEGLRIDEAKTRDMAKRELFDMRSGLTARGAFNTVANDRGTGRINRDLMYQLGGINNQRDAADITYRNTLLGLDESAIGLDNQVLDLQNRLANIGLDSRRIGISEQQLENSLADGLHNIGLGGMVSINGLLDAIGSTNTQQAALATEILQAVIGYSNLPPDVIAQINAALKPPPPPTASRDEKLPGSRMPA